MTEVERKGMVEVVVMGAGAKGAALLMVLIDLVGIVGAFNDAYGVHIGDTVLQQMTRLAGGMVGLLALVCVNQMLMLPILLNRRRYFVMQAIED